MEYLTTTWSIKIAYYKYTTDENYIPEMVKRAQEEICIQNSKHIVKKQTWVQVYVPKIIIL